MSTPTRAKTLKALRDSITHWKRMISWAKAQVGEVWIIDMIGALREVWYGDYCPLCEQFDCTTCPLAHMFGECGMTRNAWVGVSRAQTWGEWCVHATRLLEQLQMVKQNILKQKDY